MNTLLAFDTSSELMSIALARSGEVWTHDAPGGAEASAALLPAILALLARAGIGVADLDAVAFGCGPGAFTGLRTACAVAQGLAFGARVPVLPVETLWAVAADARNGAGDERVWAVTDARMDEIYAAEYSHEAGRWCVRHPPVLIAPEALGALWAVEAPQTVAGNALVAFAGRLDAGAARCVPQARPHAAAMLPLARQRAADGGALAAEHALPVYLRDKVALTSAERAARMQQAAVATPLLAAGAGSPPPRT